MKLFLSHVLLFLAIQAVMVVALTLRIWWRNRAAKQPKPLDHETDDYSWVWEVGLLKRSLVSMPNAFAELECLQASTSSEHIPGRRANVQ